MDDNSQKFSSGSAYQIGATDYEAIIQMASYNKKAEYPEPIPEPEEVTPPVEPENLMYDSVEEDASELKYEEMLSEEQEVSEPAPDEAVWDELSEKLGESQQKIMDGFLEGGSESEQEDNLAFLKRQKSTPKEREVAKRLIEETLEQKQKEGQEETSGEDYVISDDLEQIRKKLEEAGYIATDMILYSIKNALLLNMPILVEGEPGVGKTSLARAFAKAYDMELIKVQFYDGISNSDILYEYDYPKQMLYMNAIRDNINIELKGLSANEALKKLSENGINFFDKNFLIERPLLKSISGDKRKCLLLDEVDKTSEETEYLLLEILDEYAITIPEYGTVKCPKDALPVVFLTSNNYRELSEALKRRCLYLYIEPKTIEDSKKIIAARAEVSEDFALLVARKVNEIRKLNLKQKPSISDSINWAVTLMTNIGINAFDEKGVLDATLGTILKNRADIEMVRKAEIL